MENDNHLSRYTRLMELQGLPMCVRRPLAVAWCYGMAADHAEANEQLLRALEALLEGWDGKNDETARAPAEGRNGEDGERDGEADGARARDAASGSEAFQSHGERPGARLDCGGAA